jgi:SulP family sulfate permease
MLRNVIQQLRRLVVDNDLDPFPLAGTLRGYGKASLAADAKSGLSVALLAIPQGMAYAMLAGLPIHYGITCSAAAAIIGPLLCGSPYTVFGPTNATAFLISTTLFTGAAAAAGTYQEVLGLMPLLVFMVGLILVVSAYLRVADLIQYISRSVVVGYITGAAVLIIANQLRYVLGIDLSRDESRTFVGVISGLATRSQEAQWQPLLVGVLTASTYFGLRRSLRRLAFPATLVGIALVTYFLHRWMPQFAVELFDKDKFSLTQLIPQVPDFLTPTTLGGSMIGFFGKVNILFGTALGVAFLASLETSVMSKTLASQTGQPSNLNQDMLSLGVANLAGSILSGMPASGSLTRSALNYNAGARSRLSSIMSGLLCVVGILLLGGLVAYIPKTCLAALVICVAITLINRHSLRICLNATGSDAAVLITTMAAALVSRLDTAIFLGTAVSIALYLKKASKPHLAEYEFNHEGQLAEAEDAQKRRHPAISIVHVEGELFFGAAELFRTQIQHVCADSNISVIVLRLKNARHLDATSVMALEDLIKFMRKAGRHLIISGASLDVEKVLRNSGLLKVLDDDPEGVRNDTKDRNFFLNNPRNPNLSTRDALIRAQEIIGDQEADIRIFYDPSKEAEPKKN